MAWLILFPAAFALFYLRLSAFEAALFGIASVGTVTVANFLVIDAIAFVTNAACRVVRVNQMLFLGNLVTALLFVGVSCWVRPALALVAPVIGVLIFLFLHVNDQLWFAPKQPLSSNKNARPVRASAGNRARRWNGDSTSIR